MLSLNIEAKSFDWENFKQHNRKIVNSKPDNIMANFNLIIALSNTGEIQQSYKLINELGQKTTIKNFTGIITPYLDKIDKNTCDVLLLNYAAFYELIKNNYNLAISYFKRISKIESKNIWIQNYMASCYIELEKFKEAERIIKKSQQINESKFSHLLMGVIHYKNGRYVNALYEFSKSGELFGALLSEVS